MGNWLMSRKPCQRLTTVDIPVLQAPCKTKNKRETILFLGCYNGRLTRGQQIVQIY
jgi:hypothetical protein